ncbi:MFS transporter [Labrys wisconsinensis]|uniref:MFS family arabinose efflux permease n=1 Tax=Labrys wisconsinensis TaxID=425677 RepID=A0ABU0JGI4_9HYPH|nr:MFS transporter [Labrys wisconsinensis]MDQ0472247.1 putative MFS family arabinose efflux permease [Labrys wisconsinensis]
MTGPDRRWTILAVLFVARAAMAFQFQSVAALAPELGRTIGTDLADLGLLIGLYLAPGMVLAWPGGALGRRFGDKTVVLAGLALMLAGEILAAASPAWAVQILGRLVAGTGGVLLNVLTAKMIADWFAGRAIATAMAIFVGSWPAGLALALLILPPMGLAFGLGAVHASVIGLIAIAAGLVAGAYRSPPGPVAAPAGGHGALAVPEAGAVLAAGSLWSLYNIGLAMVFSFGPAMLAERGWSGAIPGSLVSLVLWLVLLSVPLGGRLADRSGRGGAILCAGCLAFAALLILLPRCGSVLPVVLALGIVAGLPAGAIMSLPARVLAPQDRAVGMGLFFTIYYAGMLIGPLLGGEIAVRAGNVGAALDFGAAVLLACPVMLGVFHLAAPRARRGTPAQAR